VLNPAFTGPNATLPPYNQKTITRHYGFGAQGASSAVTIGGINAPVPTGGWSDTTITVQVPAGIPTCAVKQRAAAANTSLCGELVITAANGKKSIDAITVTAGGSQPTVITGPDSTGHTIQNAIDAAAPGDLVIIGPGTYKEQVIMWKPVRLQGVGAASVTINADAHPAGKMDSWRRQVNCLFGLTIEGVPNPSNAGFDPDGNYKCPDGMFLRSDRIPFEGFVGWDASSNGNLAQVLQEPSLMGAYEGAGVTVLGRGVRIPGPPNADFWGAQGAGQFPDGSRYLTGSDADCTIDSTTGTMRDYGTGNYYCNPSRIDGLSIINSSQGGGGIFIHGWNHNLEVANNRISANHGTLSGGINVGNGETPPAYINDGTICGPGVATPAPLCPPLQGTPSNGQIPFALDVKVHVHNNDIYNNASLGDALFSGTPSGAGGITVSAGGDNYMVDHNWIAGNLSTGDGGGMTHSGFSANGQIRNNYFLFNQSVNPTLPTNGGGLAIVGANSDRVLAGGQECGTTTDNDCVPGIGDGTGPGLVIDSNLLIGNSAESGSGGGLRLQQINGSEVAAFPRNPERWYDVTVTNNIIANNVSGWDGAGVSLEDSLKVKFINNTVASNDTTASAGVLFKALGAGMAASPPPGCKQPDPGAPQDPNCLTPNAPHIPQPAGLVTTVNTPNMIASLSTTGTVICPAGYFYGKTVNSQGIPSDSQGSRTNGSCRALSRPFVANDMFWQNRAFHVGYADAAGNEKQDPVALSDLTSQQNLVALFPTLNQTKTGECINQSTFPSYWDVGMRGDTSLTNHQVDALLSFSGPAQTNPTLVVGNSILTSNPTGYVLDPNPTPTGSSNQVPTSSPVIKQYCNGSRAPPEFGKANSYSAQAGRSETTGLSPVFVFNNITAAATVDEGNNWINLGYGPLGLFSVAGQDLVGGALDGMTVGAYSTQPTATAAVDKGMNSVAPNTDFFGNTRPHDDNNPVDIGAVEVVRPPAVLTASVTPSPLDFGGATIGTTATKDLTVTNTGTGLLTGATVTGFTGPFSRVTGFTANCGATLAVAASCTIRVRFAPTALQAYSGSITVAYTGATVTPTPVLLNGSGVPATLLASVSPSPLSFGNFATGTTATKDLTVTNTGTGALVGGTVNGFAAPFSRVTGFTGNCGATLGIGASCTIRVRFAPAAVQAYSGSITVAYTGATVTPTPVTMTGTGVATRATASVSPNPLAITLPTGGFTGTGVVTLANTAAPGGSQIQVTDIGTASGTAGAPFNTGLLAGADTCTGTILAPGGSCTVVVRFTNLFSARGVKRTGTITFTDGGAASPAGNPVGTQTGNLTGFAP
ncbi:MAG: hypothetical protein JWO52_3293, partial [Gammaproteobacteria bacterium]|nr:hypothetical protein [Gammaproteobacteria bacterium]